MAVRGVVGDPVAGRARGVAPAPAAAPGRPAPRLGVAPGRPRRAGRADVQHRTLGVGAGREHRRARRGALAAAVVAAGRRRGGDVRGVRRRLRVLDLPDAGSAARAGRGGERAELRAAGGAHPRAGGRRAAGEHRAERRARVLRAARRACEGRRRAGHRRRGLPRRARRLAQPREQPPVPAPRRPDRPERRRVADRRLPHPVGHPGPGRPSARPHRGAQIGPAGWHLLREPLPPVLIRPTSPHRV